MTFTLPAQHNTFSVAPASNARYNSTENSPTSAGVKTAGGLPITTNVGDWERDADASTDAAGYAYEFQAAQAGYDVSGDTKLLVWHSQNNAPNRIQVNSTANHGYQVRIYTGSGSPPANYRAFWIGGNDTPMAASISGQYPFVIDLNDDTHDSSEGTFDNTDVTTFALWGRTFKMAGNSSMWNYQAHCYVLDTTKSSSSTPTFTGTSDFDDAVTLIQGTDYTDKLGNWVRKIGSVVFIDMPFRIGDNSTATTFDDKGLTIVSPVSNDTSDPRNRLTDQAMRVYLNLRNNAADTATFSGNYIWGTRAAWDFDQDDSAVVTFSSPTFRGMGEFTIGSSITGPAIWDNVDDVIMADTSVDIDGSSFRNQNGTYALQLGGAMDIANMRFETYDSAHAILIDTAGTYNFDNVFFDQSGTNDIETIHASGTVTINISNGGTIPTVSETGAGTVVINNNVTVGVTVTDTNATAIENARVRITATETVGTITNGDVILEGLTNASGVLSTTFNYESAFEPSGLDISIKVRQGTVSPYKKTSITSGVITSSGFSSTIALLPDE